jgi:hypothetical protein
LGRAPSARICGSTGRASPRRGARPAAYRGGARSGPSWFSCHGLRFPNLIKFGKLIYLGWLNTLDPHFRRFSWAKLCPINVVEVCHRRLFG